VGAVHESYAHGVSATSLVGGIIMAVGTALVLVVLPGRRRAERDRPSGEAADRAAAGTAERVDAA
ncbi:MFS transporter, partial [Streptomyces gardneri]